MNTRRYSFGSVAYQSNSESLHQPGAFEPWDMRRFMPSESFPACAIAMPYRTR